jgi:hypothetical protein
MPSISVTFWLIVVNETAEEGSIRGVDGDLDLRRIRCGVELHLVVLFQKELRGDRIEKIPSSIVIVPMLLGAVSKDGSTRQLSGAEYIAPMSAWLLIKKPNGKVALPVGGRNQSSEADKSLSV